MNSFGNCSNNYAPNSNCGGGCDCLIWILILLLCCGGCGSSNNGCGCGCILPLIVILCCCGCGGNNGCKC